MRNYFSRKKWFVAGIVFLGIGFLGGIFFFPVNINSRYTCLYHRLFSGDVHRGMARHHHNPPNPDQSSPTETLSSDRLIPKGNPPEFESVDLTESDILNRYILPFGFFWWISLFLFIFGYYLIRHFSSRNYKKTISSQWK